MQVVITNVAGERVKEFAAATEKGVRLIPVQLNVPSGIYILSVIGSDSRFMVKVVVNP